MKKTNHPLYHLAIIPDGNRRWAKKHNLPIFLGHKKGFDVLIKISKKAFKMGVKIITVWGFSTENWQRDKKEISDLMKLFFQTAKKFLQQALKNKIRIIHLGRKDRLDKKLINLIKKIEKKTKKFNDYYLCIALDYGGRDEILRAIKKIIKSKEENIDEKKFFQFLDTKDLPYPSPDLIIRTSGEKRLSGFLSWQSAYSELIFIKKYFPDFTKKDLERCFLDYYRRKRRYGK